MAQFSLKFSIICVNVLVIYAAASTFNAVSNDTKQCEDKCTKSFAPHTYPNGSDNDACMRGCRLYTVTSFITESAPHTNSIDDHELSPAKDLCYQSCIDAYNETSASTIACKSGCDTQEMLSLEKKSLKETGDYEGVHFMRPVMQIKEVMSKVVGMLRIVQSSITTYFLRDDNEMVAVEGPVEVMVQLVPPSQIEEAKSESEREQQQQQQENSFSNNLVSSGTASIECLSKRVGVPPYLLVISLVSFVILLSYILFVICLSNNKKEKKMKSGLPIPSNVLPVKLVRPEDLTKLSLMDDEEGALSGFSTKFKVPDATRL